MSVNDELLNKAIRHAVYFDQLTTGEVNRMVKFMDRELFPDMKRILERRLGNIGNGAGRGAWTTARYKRMVEMLDKQIDAGFRFMSQEAKARLARVGISEAKWAQANLQQTVPLDVTFNSVDLNTVRSIVSSRPFQGALLKDWYKELGTRFKADMRKQLNIGFASGESVPQITARIMGIRGVESGFTGSSVRAQTRRKVRAVVRTSTNHIASKTRSAVYAENADIISKVRWVSTLDSRTTDICQSLDGQEWKLGQEQTPPAHHQCRSTTVPITKTWKQLGLNAKDKRVGGRIYRDVQSGMSKVSPKHITYGDWLKKQPAQVQNDVLGIGKANLLRQGVPFNRFFSNNRALSLAEMNAIEGITVPELATVPSTLPRATASKAEWEAFSKHLRKSIQDYTENEKSGLQKWFSTSKPVKEYLENPKRVGGKYVPLAETKERFNPRVVDQIMGFVNAVDDMPTIPQPTTVFRGLKIEKTIVEGLDGLDEVKHLLNKGSVFEQITHSSSSAHLSIGHSFANAENTKSFLNAVLEIRGKGFKHMKNLTERFKSEYELLIARGQKFRVKDVIKMTKDSKEWKDYEYRFKVSKMIERAVLVDKKFVKNYKKTELAINEYMIRNDVANKIMYGTKQQHQKIWEDILRITGNDGKMVNEAPKFGKRLENSIKYADSYTFMDLREGFTRIVIEEI
ncbi:MAG: hypothetical protein CMC15_15810 [Flavobacteriaceae bacterium]|nr:hypothetical protein [Flavobacteriaceae bacterium]